MSVIFCPEVASGTVYAAYDGLNRVQWRGPNANGSTPFATYYYDSTTGGNQGVGHLTQELFASNGQTGQYLNTYDARGRKTAWSETVNGNTWSFTQAYNDASGVCGLWERDDEGSIGNTELQSYGYNGNNTMNTGPEGSMK